MALSATSETLSLVNDRLSQARTLAGTNASRANLEALGLGGSVDRSDLALLRDLLAASLADVEALLG